MFVESFQGQYKDGTNGTRDFRMVSASFFILRILIMTSYLTSVFAFHSQSLGISSGVQYVLFIAASCIIAVIRPYNMNLRNSGDFLILVLLEILSSELLFEAYHTSASLSTQYILGSTLFAGVPHLILIFYIFCVLARKAGIIECLKRKYEILKRCIQAIRNTSQAETDTEADGSLPDRLINPGAYELLPPTTEKHTAAEHTENEEPVNQDPKRLTPVYTYGSIS